LTYSHAQACMLGFQNFSRRRGIARALCRVAQKSQAECTARCGTYS